MVKRLDLTAHIQKLDSAYNERKSAPLQKPDVTATEPQTAPRSSNTGESLSTVDSVQNEQCSSRTVLKTDSIQRAQCLKQTVSKADSVGKAPQSVGNRLQGNFTQVPNVLLRTAGLFEDPFDFMIYLHLYSFSFGFNRPTVDMSQAQLEAFAGVSKNRVKRALERLVKQRWIKVVGQYEPGRVSRKWLVTDPVSKTDTVQNGQCPERTPRVSAVNTVTVSKMDTYKEREQKQFQTNPLSTLSEKAKAYFSELKPAGKREGELQAFRELLDDYSEGAIWQAAEWLGKKGALDGSPCFAPMAYLRKAMGEVLRVVEAETMRVEKRGKLNAAVMATRIGLEAEAERRVEEWGRK